MKIINKLMPAAAFSALLAALVLFWAGRASQPGLGREGGDQLDDERSGAVRPFLGRAGREHGRSAGGRRSSISSASSRRGS